MTDKPSRINWKKIALEYENELASLTAQFDHFARRDVAQKEEIQSLKETIALIRRVLKESDRDQTWP